MHKYLITTVLLSTMLIAWDKGAYQAGGMDKGAYQTEEESGGGGAACSNWLVYIDTTKVWCDAIAASCSLVCDSGKIWYQYTADTTGAITSDSTVHRGAAIVYTDTTGELEPSTDYWIRFMFDADTGTGKDTTSWDAVTTRDSTDTSTYWLFWVENDSTVHVWDNSTGDNKYSTAANWTPAFLPAATDTIILNATSTANLTVDGNYVWKDFRKTAAYTGNIYFGATTDTTRGNMSLLGDANDTAFLQTATLPFLGDWKCGITISSGTSTLVANGTGRQVFKCGGLYYDVQNPNNTGSLIDSTVGGMRTAGDITSRRTGRWLDGFTCAGDFNFDTAGATVDTCQIADTVKMTGNSGLFHIGIGTSPQMASGILTMNTKNAGVLDVDALNTFTKLIIAPSCTATVSGAAATFTLSSADIALILGDNSKLTSNQVLLIRRSTAGDIYSQSASAYWGGSGNFSIRSAATSGVNNLPYLNYSGSGAIAIQENAAGSIVSFLQTGNIGTAGALSIFRNNGTNGNIYTQGGYSLTCASLNIGCNAAGGTFTWNARGNTTVTGAVNATAYNSGTTTVNDSIGEKSVGTNLGWQTTHTHNTAPGANWTATGAGSWTSAGKFHPKKFTVNASGATVTMADRWAVDTLNVAAGTMAITDHAGADSVIGDATITGTANFASDTVYYGGNLTLAAASTISATTGKWIMGKDGVTLAVNGKSIPLVQLIGTAHFTSTAATGGTIAAINLAAGDTVTLQAAKKWTFTALDSAALSGTALLKKFWFSSIAGTGDTMGFPDGKIRVTNAKFRDTKTGTADTLNCQYSDSCISLGGN